jgi:cephalosporin hydroxylase
MFKIKKIDKEEKVDVSIQSISDGHHKVTYKGIKAIRCPFDYLMYQMIIWEVKPDLVIEIGANEGGGALYIADLLDVIGKGEVHSIDIIDKVDPIVREHNRITFFMEGWDKYDLNLANGYETILIIEDASHQYKDSIGILNKFHHLVTINSYFIVEDGIVSNFGIEKKFGGGPLKAIREFLPEHPEYIVDRKWCDMFGKNATFNVNGYLKKIKN